MKKFWIPSLLGLAFGCILGLVFLFLFYCQDKEDDWCDPKNSAYIELQENVDDWLWHFSTGGTGFSLSKGETTRPWVYSYTFEDDKTIAVIVETEFGHGFYPGYGTYGYFYSSTGLIPDEFFQVNGKTEIVLLGDGFFCYRIERGYISN